MSLKHSATDGRTAIFSRNVRLEALLKEINSSLWVAEKEILKDDQATNFPMLFVMGPMRSGTTLFMQWLANTGLIAYPTNLLSRFYQAPVIGAKIQLLLTDPRYNFRDELGEFTQQSEYKSENGKTKGALAPNEFWYFWRRFLAEPGRDVWTDDELWKSMDTQTMLAELAGIMDVFEKPFAANGKLFNYNIPFLDSLFEKALFVQIKRDPISNIASVLNARRQQFGSEEAWYSFKIPEYSQLKSLDPIAQCAGHVHYIDKAVSQGMSQVDESRKLVVYYEDFCNDPCSVFNKLTSKIGMDGEPYKGPEQFKPQRSVSNSDSALILKAIDLFTGDC